MSGEILVDKKEAARRLSLSTRKIDELRLNGDLSAKQCGSKILFKVAELERFAESLPDDEPRSA